MRRPHQSERFVSEELVSLFLLILLIVLERIPIH